MSSLLTYGCALHPTLQLLHVPYIGLGCAPVICHGHHDFVSDDLLFVESVEALIMTQYII